MNFYFGVDTSKKEQIFFISAIDDAYIIIDLCKIKIGVANYWAFQMANISMEHYMAEMKGCGCDMNTIKCESLHETPWISLHALGSSYMYISEGSKYIALWMPWFEEFS